ncbi:hypothetical protein GGR56DRAFT_89219 [Xylariaceae sp. FL0804]|nr:hypothetical protein GGR56DRAFT_89219 [Xylariaceae sp. FL0804]
MKMVKCAAYPGAPRRNLNGRLAVVLVFALQVLLAVKFQRDRADMRSFCGRACTFPSFRYCFLSCRRAGVSVQVQVAVGCRNAGFVELRIALPLVVSYSGGGKRMRPTRQVKNGKITTVLLGNVVAEKGL